MREQNQSGGPAFPQPINPGEYGRGMTLRDYFAAKAMQAWFPTWERDQDFDLCKRAYRLADAMIKARQE